MIKFAILALVLSLAGCATNSPQQTVYGLESGYEILLTGAVTYKELPPCTKASPPCSSPEIVKQLRLASSVARPALEAAEVAVRDPAFNGTIADKAIATARVALDAFKAIMLKFSIPIPTPAE